jgi:hypothetical protein
VATPMQGNGVIRYPVRLRAAMSGRERATVKKLDFIRLFVRMERVTHG